MMKMADALTKEVLIELLASLRNFVRRTEGVNLIPTSRIEMLYKVYEQHGDLRDTIDAILLQLSANETHAKFIEKAGFSIDENE